MKIFGVCYDEVRGRGLRTRGGSGRREGNIGHLNTVATHNGHVAIVSATLRLNKGDNTVRLHNDSQRMPDIDCMIIKQN